MQEQPASGLYNVGSGKARTFLDLVNAIFQTLGLAPSVHFVDTPADIRDKYQYFTEANMGKMQDAGYSRSIHSLEEGVTDYVRNYLMPGSYF
jgi:ADP-L-glycero-D-manno-heptose 6-epimerase